MRSAKPRYIAVEGPIGVGKSSLAEILGQELSARVILDERPQENPFLGAFYRDRSGTRCRSSCSSCCSATPSRASWRRAICFRGAASSPTTSSQKDRLFASLNLTDDELTLYDRIYQMLKVRTVRPDLIVYLQARTEVLVDRIRRRARPEEKPIRSEYVQQVAQAYADFFFNYNEGPLLIVNASDIDFVGNAEHRRELISVIQNAPPGTSHWSRG